MAAPERINLFDDCGTDEHQTVVAGFLLAITLALATLPLRRSGGSARRGFAYAR